MAQSLRRDSHAQRSLYGYGEVQPISAQVKSSIGSHELNARDTSGRDRAGLLEIHLRHFIQQSLLLCRLKIGDYICEIVN